VTTEDLVGQYGYLGIILLLILGGLGLPVPEEAPVVLAAILTKHDQMNVFLAFGSCLLGVLLGDFVVYFLGYYYGERVLGFRLTRKVLTRAREEQLKGYFVRHGFKILIVGRFAVGFRTAAYLTAGILRLPALKLLGIDLVAATLSTSLMFLLGYVFAHQIEAVLKGAQHWAVAIAAVAVAGFLIYRYVQGRRKAGQAVGPKILVGPDVPLPPDDLAVRKALSASGIHPAAIMEATSLPVEKPAPVVEAPPEPPTLPTDGDVVPTGPDSNGSVSAAVPSEAGPPGPAEGVD
jgi:membrane protein DedA with SNARE-associated domain